METVQNYLEVFNNKARNFEMFSQRANRRCQTMVSKVIKELMGNKRVIKPALIIKLKMEMEKIAETYSEIWDTEPPQHICGYVNKALKLEGYNFEIDSGELF